MKPSTGAARPSPTAASTAAAVVHGIVRRNPASWSMLRVPASWSTAPSPGTARLCTASATTRKHHRSMHRCRGVEREAASRAERTHGGVRQQALESVCGKANSAPASMVVAPASVIA